MSAATLDMGRPSGLRRRLAIAAVLGAMAVAVLDAASTNVALPVIARSFAVAPARAIWVVTAYQAALVMALLPAASLGERFGLRRCFLAGLALFAGAAALAALAPAFPLLVAARFVQGLGAAAIMALGVALLRHSVAADELGDAIGWNALTVALCTAAGPIYGAALLTSGGWPALFAADVPVALLALAAGMALPTTPGRAGLFDPPAMLAYAAIALLLVATIQIRALPLIVTALAAAALFVCRERRRDRPFLPLDLLANRSFAGSVLASICCFAGQGAALVALPFFLHQRFGTSPAETGLLMTVWPLAVACTTPVTARLLRKIDAARLCAAGGLALAAGLAALALVRPDSPLLILPFTALAGVGFGLFQTPNNRTMFLAAPPERSAAAGGLQGTARLAGQTLGALAMGLFFVTWPVAPAARAGFAFAALATLAAALVSLLRQRESATATPRSAA